MIVRLFFFLHNSTINTPILFYYAAEANKKLMIVQLFSVDFLYRLIIDYLN